MQLRIGNLFPVPVFLQKINQPAHRFCQCHEAVLRLNLLELPRKLRGLQKSRALLIFPRGQDHVTAVRLSLPEQLQQMRMSIEDSTALAIIPAGAAADFPQAAKAKGPWPLLPVLIEQE
ncbi:hypothetical protein D3C77_502720 [compost metagenome]